MAQQHRLTTHLARFALVSGAGHVAAFIDDLRSGRSNAELSHLARDADRRRRGAKSPGDGFGAIGLGEGQYGWTGAAETGAQSAAAARGTDQDLEMREEPGAVGLVQAVMHSGRDEAGVAGMQAEDETTGGGHVEGCVGMGDRRRQRGAGGAGESGYLRYEDDGTEVEPAVGEEL